MYVLSWYVWSFSNGYRVIRGERALMKGSLPPHLLSSRRRNRKAMGGEIGGKQSVLWQQEMFSLNGSSAIT